MPKRENTKLDKILTLSVSTSWIKLFKSLSLYIMHVIWSSKTQYMYTKRQLTYSTKTGLEIATDTVAFAT